MVLSRLFKNPYFHSPFLRTLGYASQGGSEVGECLAVASAIVGAGETRKAWTDAWASMARIVQVKGEESLARGHLVSARSSLLRATEYHRQSTAFGDHFDLATREATQRMRSCFELASDLASSGVDRTVLPLRTRQGTIDVPVAFHHATVGKTSPAQRPTIVFPAEDTLEEATFTVARAMCERGFNVLVFEGPGSGRLFADKGFPWQSDWNELFSGVVRWCEMREDVAPEKMVLMARGPSSYPALHYAASTSNLAAVVLDFAEQDPDSLLQSALNASQSPELKSLLTRNSRNEVDAWYRSAVLHLSDASHLPTTYEAGDMRRHFFETQFARMGVSTLSSYLDAVAKMDPIPLASQIKPPVLLVTNAPPTPFSQTLLDSFSTSDKMLLVLQQSHGETVGREGSVRNVSYWLKEVLARGGEGAERVVRVAASA